MRTEEHLQITAGALKHWLIAQTYDALLVGAMWLVGLLTIRVPLAPLWAILGGLFQLIPNVGPVLALFGPAVTLGVSGLLGGDWIRLIYLLIVYAIIAAVDGFVLQPWLMKRTARVPVWASIVVPIAMGIVLGFWGVLISAPMLAIIYAYRRRRPPDAHRIQP